jgi:glucuronate isomerase
MLQHIRRVLYAISNVHKLNINISLSIDREKAVSTKIGTAFLYVTFPKVMERGRKGTVQLFYLTNPITFSLDYSQNVKHEARREYRSRFFCRYSNTFYENDEAKASEVGTTENER